MANGNGSVKMMAPMKTVPPEAVKMINQHRARRGDSAQLNDSWFNQRTRFGGAADPVIKSVYIRKRARIDREEAEALYENDWLTARAVDQLPWDATREWVLLTHKTNPDIAEKLREEDQKWDGRGKFKESMSWARLHGGSLLVLGADDGQDPEEQELEIERVKELKFANPIDRWLCFPSRWYEDDQDARFGTVEQYQVHQLVPTGAPVVKVHESRVIKFDGNPLPKRALIRNWGWNASILEKLYDALRNWGVANQAAAMVVPSFITTKMKIANLQQLIQNEDWTTIQARLNEIAAQLAINNMAFFGPDEELEKMGTNIAGLPDLMDRFMQIVSGAVGVPKSILFQAESGALGGNAASVDVRNWHATVSAYQNTYLRPRVRRWLDILGVPLGIKPGEVEFEFAPLSVMTEKEQAEVYQITTTADAAAIQAGLVDVPERLAVYRMSGKTWNGAPPVLDTKRMEKVVDEFDALEPVAVDPKQAEAMQQEMTGQQIQQGEQFLQQGQEGGGGSDQGGGGSDQGGGDNPEPGERP